MIKDLLFAAAPDNIGDPFWPDVLLYVTGDGSAENLAKPGEILRREADGGFATYANSNPFGTGQCFEPAQLNCPSSKLKGAVTSLPGAFTVEAFARMPVNDETSFSDAFFTNRDVGFNPVFDIYVQYVGAGASDEFYVQSFTFTPFSVTDTTPNVAAGNGGWFHIAFVRDTEIRVYINGVSQTLNPAPDPAMLLELSTAELKIGLAYMNTAYYRITQAARYTADFDPPTAPFPEF